MCPHNDDEQITGPALLSGLLAVAKQLGRVADGLAIGKKLDRILRGQEDHDDLLVESKRQTLGGIDQILTELRRQHPKPRGLNPAITSIHGRSPSAMNVPVPKLLDTEKILLSVMPRKEDGHVDVGATVTWASSDESAVGIDPGTESFEFHDPQFDETVTCPGAFNCYALTPNQSGSATVTASAAGYESAEFGPIEYAPGVPRSLNASVGSPISDL